MGNETGVLVIFYLGAGAIVTGTVERMKGWMAHLTASQAQGSLTLSWNPEDL